MVSLFFGSFTKKIKKKKKENKQTKQKAQKEPGQYTAIYWLQVKNV